MASANQTIHDSGLEFEADGTEHTATLDTPGGYVRNTGTVDAVINVINEACVLTHPVGGGNMYIPAGKTYPLPNDCSKFRFKSTGASTWLDVRKLIGF